jgi:hypothetical protein
MPEVGKACVGWGPGLSFAWADPEPDWDEGRRSGAGTNSETGIKRMKWKDHLQEI